MHPGMPHKKFQKTLDFPLTRLVESYFGLGSQAINRMNNVSRSQGISDGNDLFGLRLQQQEYGLLITGKVWQFHMLMRFAHAVLGKYIFSLGFSCLVLLLPSAATIR